MTRELVSRAILAETDQKLGPDWPISWSSFGRERGRRFFGRLLRISSCFFKGLLVNQRKKVAGEPQGGLLPHKTQFSRVFSALLLGYLKMPSPAPEYSRAPPERLVLALLRCFVVISMFYTRFSSFLVFLSSRAPPRQIIRGFRHEKVCLFQEFGRIFRLFGIFRRAAFVRRKGSLFFLVS